MKQDFDSCFGVVDCSNEGCSCSSFSVVKEESITSKLEERDITMVIILWDGYYFVGCETVMVIILLELL
jgi:hypothetical protein